MATTAEEQKSNAQIISISKILEARKAKFAELLPKSLSPERLIKVAINCVAKTPALQNCSGSSLVQALNVAAELGLEPGGALGHLYLVPFGQVCTPIIGYRGLIELARRSGQLAQIEAHVVHEKDEFRVEFGLVPVMRHVPYLQGDAGRPLMVYMLARLKDGSTHVEVMTIADVNKVRARSRAAQSGPWVTDYEEMCRKTVVRRGMKYLPLAADDKLARALEVDDDDYVDGEVIRPALASDNAIATELVASPQNEKAKAAVKARKMEIKEVAAAPATPPANGANGVTAHGEPPPDVVLQGNLGPNPPQNDDIPF